MLDSPTSRLDLVVAPPGSGKTTLLARVPRRRDRAGRLVPGDRRRHREADLVAHLGRALRDTLGIEEPIDHRFAARSARGMVRHRPMLILDDLHEIAGSAAERALEQFVELRPHTCGSS